MLENLNINDELFNNSISSVEIIEIPIDKIIVDEENQRKDVNQNALIELANSIKAIGLINPITVAKYDDKFKLVAGFRRLSACRLLNYEHIQAKIIADSATLNILVHLDENNKRERFTELQEAEYFASIIHKLQLTYEQLAKVIDKTPAFISQRLSILKWNDKLRQALINEELSYSVCRELNRVKDKEQLENFIYHAVTSGVNWKTVKKWVDEYVEVQEQYEQATQPPLIEQEATATADAEPTPFLPHIQEKIQYININKPLGYIEAEAEAAAFQAGDEAGLDVPKMSICDECDEVLPAETIQYYKICDDCIQNYRYAVYFMQKAEQMNIAEQVHQAIEAEQ